MWDGGRRYYARFEYDQKQFHCRVMKAVVDGGFSCPNLDGTKGTGGCIFCDGEAAISPIPAALQNNCKRNGHAFMQSSQLQS